MKKPNIEKIQAHAVSEKSALLEYLLKHFTQYKKSRVKQMLKYGSVRVNGKVMTHHLQKIRPGDKIEFLTKEKAHAEQVKVRLGFSVVYEDDQVYIIDKPPGLLTMGTDKEKERTVFFKLTAFRRAQNADVRGRIYLVHRLDRETSGLLVFAKSEAVQKALQDSWTKAVKKYYAVVEGIPEKDRGQIRTHLKEDQSRRVHQVKETVRDARPAETHYIVARQGASRALLDVTLKTGRKNQIRVHFAGMGHPIVGDMKYGAKSGPRQRLALHAYRIAFLHPKSGSMISFESKMPEEFEEILAIRVPAGRRPPVPPTGERHDGRKFHGKKRDGKKSYGKKGGTLRPRHR